MTMTTTEDREASRGGILVIEDDADLRALLAFNLEQAGYRVASAQSGREGLQRLAERPTRLVLLDLMLPDISGTEVCREIRAQAGTAQPAILMLTASGGEIDRVVAFEVGVDDYVIKPFSMRELLLRIATRIRDRRPRPPSEFALGRDAQGSRSAEVPAPGTAAPARRVLTAGPLTVDPDGFHVYVEGAELHVSHMEMRLLVHLMDARGLVHSRRDLLGVVWGYRNGATSRTVDTHVKRLRDKLGPAGRLIETVRGSGYRFADSSGFPIEPHDKVGGASRA
jgi:two-component system phosphate regulon response regulator PhoB